MKAFNFLNPADTAYHSLWNTIIALPGFKQPDEIVPDRADQLVLGSDSGVIYVSDGNNANVAGMPVLQGSSLTFQGYGANNVSLKDIYIKGNGLAVSGWIKWH